MKKVLNKKQIEDYEKLCHDRTKGRLLTPDGLIFICKANNYDPEAIGRLFIEKAKQFEVEEKRVE